MHTWVPNDSRYLSDVFGDDRLHRS
jgi:hypothetical protein